MIGALSRMSIEHSTGRSNGEPTIQEKLLMQLDDHDYESAIPHVVADLEKGYSPSALSIARPDVLTGFAEAWQHEVAGLPKESTPETTFKVRHFEDLVEIATTGNPAAIEALSKFVTSLGQMTLVATLVLDNKEAIKESLERKGRPPESIKEHELVVEAIKHGEVEKALDAMSHHLKNSRF